MHIFTVFIILFADIFMSTFNSSLINTYETNEGNISVFETIIILADISGNPVDSVCTEPWVISDCCIDPQNEYLFVILGERGASRGGRLAIFSTAKGEVKQFWIDVNRGHNPWMITAADVDGDACLDICVGVWKKARFHPVFDNRLFIYSWDGTQIFPKWMGSRLSSPFIDFDFQDIDGDDIVELIALELQRNGLNRIISYKWRGFGFEEFKVLQKDIKEENLDNFNPKKREFRK